MSFSKQQLSEYFLDNDVVILRSDANEIIDANFWIEDGDSSCFLMAWVRDHDQIECIGGCDRVDDKWVSSINNDANLHEGDDKVKALDALWDARERAIVYANFTIPVSIN